VEWRSDDLVEADEDVEAVAFEAFPMAPVTGAARRSAPVVLP